MSHFLWHLLQWLKPLQIPFYFGAAWLFLLYLGMTLGQFVQDVWQRSRIMHRIPCHNCQFFTNDHRLKCPIHPLAANSETAINCRDYAAQTLSSP
jgi:hypothetical protein